MSSSQKPIEWVSSLLTRFEDQLPYRCGAQSNISRLNVEQNKEALVNISKYKFQIVVSGLTRILHSITELQKTIGQVPNEIESNFFKSQIIVLDALHHCFMQQQNEQSRDDSFNVKILISEICLLIDTPGETSLAESLRLQARSLLFAVSLNNFFAIFGHFSRALEYYSKELTINEENSDFIDIELIRHIKFDLIKLVKLFTEVNEKFRALKKNVCYIVFTSVEIAIWNWIENCPNEFMRLQTEQKDTFTDCCSKFFDLLDNYVESNLKKRNTVWPLQMLLLVLCPKILEEVNNQENSLMSTSTRYTRKRFFVENLKKSLQSSASNKQITEAGTITYVKLCKAATYINMLDLNNPVFKLVQSILSDLKNLLFNPNKPFVRTQNQQDVDLMIDCFIALFRLASHNNDLLHICLNQNSPFIFHYVLISSLCRITKQTHRQLPWWPAIDVVFDKAPELRLMLSDTLNRTTQGYTNHTPLKMMQSLSLKDKMSNLKFKEKCDDLNNYKSLLLSFLRLIQSVPKLMLNSEMKNENDCQNATMELINGLVSLVIQTNMKEISDEAMFALLTLHEADNIELWNPLNPINTFWEISSQVINTIAQKLIKQQLPNYSQILRWLREIFKLRNAFLLRHREYSNQGSQLNICKQAHNRAEQVFLMYLWSVDVETVVMSMSCFALLCEEADIRCGQNEITINYLLPNYQIYSEISAASTAIVIGRAALQKRIMSLLRRIDKCTPGCLAAWGETWIYCDRTTKQLMNTKQKNETENLSSEALLARNVQKRRQSQPVDHDSEDHFIEWTNAMGFLCALGGVCVQQQSIKSATFFNQTAPDLSFDWSIRKNSSVESDSLNQFIELLLKLLMSPEIASNEKYCTHIEKHVKEFVSLELNPVLHPLLFIHIHSALNKFFDFKHRFIISEINTKFVFHMIFIVKQLLENKREGSNEYLSSVTCFEAVMTVMIKYIRHYENDENFHLKTKFCQLLELMMLKRDFLTFRQEIKFRNRMVEYVADWLLTVREGNVQVCPKILSVFILSSIRAMASLLKGLPLKINPEENDLSNEQDARSILYLKYFNMLMGMLNTYESTKNQNNQSNVMQSKDQDEKLDEIRSYIIQAMTNLLFANIDTGLVHSIHLGNHNDLQTRNAFIEVLNEILAQGAKFEMLAETVLADHYEQLINLVTMMSDKGELEIAMSLSSVVKTPEMDELSRVFVTLFDSKHMLTQLFLNIFQKEVEWSDSIQTLFRGNSLGSKIMAFCFKIYGNNYLKTLIGPILEKMIDNPILSYEVDQVRLEKDEDLDENRENLRSLTKKVFDTIINSHDQFPLHLKLMCKCLHKVLLKRYQTTSQSNPKQTVSVIGTILFLRFINPTIVSPCETGIVDKQPTSKTRRGLMLMSKILQNIANNVVFSKEQHMLYFNDFLRENFEIEKQWVSNLVFSDVEENEHTQNVMFNTDSNMVSLHRILWTNQEKIGDYLTNLRDQKATGRRPFDKMAVLLAYLGPPVCKTSKGLQWNSFNMTSAKFDEIIAKLNLEENDEFKHIRSLGIFYQAGTSKSGNPVFYFIPRRYKISEASKDLFIFHVILTLKPFSHRSFELVIDFTHTLPENRFSSEDLEKWFSVLPQIAYERIERTYIYNCNSCVYEFFKIHERILSILNASPKIIFLDEIQQLNEFIEPHEQFFPESTMILTEDLLEFFDGFNVTRGILRADIRVGPTSVQICTIDRCNILNQAAVLNDIYYASEIDTICVLDRTQINMTLVNDRGCVSFVHPDAPPLINKIIIMRKKWENYHGISKDAKIRLKDVPGKLLNLALLNLGSTDLRLRSSAHILLCTIVKIFDLKLDKQLLKTPGIFIPRNSFIFVKQISEKMASNSYNSSALTLELFDECLHSFLLSETFESKHLCLDYMSPWIANLGEFSNHPDEKKRQKVVMIIEKLVSITVEEFPMYLAMQEKIWINIGRVPEIAEIVLDCFIKQSVDPSLSSEAEEKLTDSIVSLSTNDGLIVSLMTDRLCKLISKTSASPTLNLEPYSNDDHIVILIRFLLIVSFNNKSFINCVPELFHIITILIHTDPPIIRKTLHNLLINIIHSLCTCYTHYFSEQTLRTLKLSLDEFSLEKYLIRFGINCTDQSPNTVLSSISTYNQVQNNHPSNVADSQSQNTCQNNLSKLQDIEAITDSLLELMEECMKDLKDYNWLNRWLELSSSIAFQYNPTLQYKAIIIHSCIAKTFTQREIKQLFLSLIRALEIYDHNSQLIESIGIGFIRVLPTLPSDSPLHMVLFWVAIFMLQLDKMDLYSIGLALLEQNLHILDNLGKFDTKTVEQMMMEARDSLEWNFKQLEISIGLSFKSNFHFALVGHLIKAYRHPNQSTVSRAIRILNTLLNILAKPKDQDKFEVTSDNIAYLIALMPVSEEVQSRCHLKNKIRLVSSSQIQFGLERTGRDFQLKSHIEEPFILKSQQSLPISCNPENGNQGAQKMLSLDLSYLTRKQTSIDSHETDALQFGHYLHPIRNNSHPLQRPRSLSPRNTRTVDFTQLSNSSSSDLNQGALFKRDERKLTQSQKDMQIDSRFIDLNENPSVYERKSCTEQKLENYAESMKEDKISLKSIELDEKNVLLDPEIIKDEKTQALVLALLATLVRNTNELENSRVLFLYLAEGSQVFSKIFPVIHSLLDAKLTSVLNLCHDQVTIGAVQNIIQNMIVGGDIGQQQLHYLYSVGFGGLWRFSGPFKSNSGECNDDSAKQFHNCLESLVHSFLPYEIENDNSHSETKPGGLTTSKSSGTLFSYGENSQHVRYHNRQVSMDQNMTTSSLSSIRFEASISGSRKNSSSENDLVSFATIDHL